MVQGFVPQKQILNDKRTIAFISHGGGNSITEALYYAVPLIGFPVDSD